MDERGEGTESLNPQKALKTYTVHTQNVTHLA